MNNIIKETYDLDYNENIVKKLTNLTELTNEIRQEIQLDGEFNLLEYLVFADNFNLMRSEHTNLVPNKIDKNGNSILHYAVMLNRSNIVKLLMEHGVNVNIQNNNKETALMVAAKNKLLNSSIAFLNQETSDLNIQNNDGKTALMIACESQLINFMTLVFQNPKVAKKIDYNLKDTDGNILQYYIFNTGMPSLFDDALKYTDEEIQNNPKFDLLKWSNHGYLETLKKELSTRQQNNNQNTILNTTPQQNEYSTKIIEHIKNASLDPMLLIGSEILEQNQDIFDVLLTENKMDFNYVIEKNKNPILIEYIFRGYNECTTKLIDQGKCDINLRSTKDGLSPLLAALVKGDMDLAIKIMDAGGVLDLNQEIDKKIIFSLSAYNAKKILSEILGNTKIKTNHPDLTEATCKAICLNIIKVSLFSNEVENGNLLEVKNALKSSSDSEKAMLLTHHGSKEENVLVTATVADNVKMMELLISHGANIQHQNLDNSNLLDIACSTNSPNAVKYLIEKHKFNPNLSNSKVIPIFRAMQSQINNVKKDQYSALDALLKYETDLTLKNEHGNSVLTVLIQNSRCHLLMDKFLQSKLIIDYSELNNVFINYASMYPDPFVKLINNTELLSKFITSFKIDFNQAKSFFNSIFLQGIKESENNPTLSLLLNSNSSQRANINLMIEINAIHRLVYFDDDGGHISTLGQILKIYPDLINSKSDNGDTPIMSAIRYKQRQMFKHLLLLGADLKIRNHDGENAHDLIEKLLKELLVNEDDEFAINEMNIYANSNHEYEMDQNHRTPLINFIIKNSKLNDQKTIKELESLIQKSDIYHRDSINQDALIYAAFSGNEKFCRTLLRHYNPINKFFGEQNFLHILVICSINDLLKEYLEKDDLEIPEDLLTFAVTKIDNGDQFKRVITKKESYETFNLILNFAKNNFNASRFSSFINHTTDKNDHSINTLCAMNDNFLDMLKSFYTNGGIVTKESYIKSLEITLGNEVENNIQWETLTYLLGKTEHSIDNRGLIAKISQQAILQHKHEVIDILKEKHLKKEELNAIITNVIKENQFSIFKYLMSIDIEFTSEHLNLIFKENNNKFGKYVINNFSKTSFNITNKELIDAPINVKRNYIKAKFFSNALYNGNNSILQSIKESSDFQNIKITNNNLCIKIIRTIIIKNNLLAFQTLVKSFEFNFTPETIKLIIQSKNDKLFDELLKVIHQVRYENNAKQSGPEHYTWMNNLENCIAYNIVSISNKDYLLKLIKKTSNIDKNELVNLAIKSESEKLFKGLIIDAKIELTESNIINVTNVEKIEILNVILNNSKKIKFKGKNSPLEQDLIYKIFIFSCYKESPQLLQHIANTNLKFSNSKDSDIKSSTIFSQVINNGFIEHFKILINDVKLKLTIHDVIHIMKNDNPEFLDLISTNLQNKINFSPKDTIEYSGSRKNISEIASELKKTDIANIFKDLMSKNSINSDSWMDDDRKKRKKKNGKHNKPKKKHTNKRTSTSRDISKKEKKVEEIPNNKPHNDTGKSNKSKTHQERAKKHYNVNDFQIALKELKSDGEMFYGFDDFNPELLHELDGNNMSILSHAIINGRSDFALKVLKSMKTEQINQIDNYVRSPLIYALIGQHEIIVNGLMKLPNININLPKIIEYSKNSKNETLLKKVKSLSPKNIEDLLIRINNGDSEIDISQLSRAELNKTCANGKTILMNSLEANNQDAFKLLINKTNILKENQDGTSCIYKIIKNKSKYHNYLDIISKHYEWDMVLFYYFTNDISKGMNMLHNIDEIDDHILNYIDDQNTINLFHYAIEKGSEEFTLKMIDKLNKKTLNHTRLSDGLVPIISAINSQKHKVVIAILNSGKYQQTLKSDWALFNYALKTSNTSLLDFLGNEFCINQYSYNDHPLVLAIRDSNTPIVEWILYTERRVYLFPELKEDIIKSTLNEDLKQAMLSSIIPNIKTFEELLVARKNNESDINLSKLDKKSPCENIIKYALENNDYNLIELLQEHIDNFVNELLKKPTYLILAIKSLSMVEKIFNKLTLEEIYDKELPGCLKFANPELYEIFNIMMRKRLDHITENETKLVKELHYFIKHLCDHNNDDHKKYVELIKDHRLYKLELAKFNQLEHAK